MVVVENRSYFFEMPEVTKKDERGRELKKRGGDGVIQQQMTAWQIPLRQNAAA